MIRRATLLASCVLAALPVPALAQLGSPVATPQQQGNPTARGAAAAQVAVPPAEVTPYQPTVIETPVTAPAEPPRDLPARPAPTTPPSEYESFVSAAAGTPLRRFGADLLVPGARDFTAGPTATIPPDYRLNPGDEVLLGLTGSVQASNLRLTIDSEGRIFVPRIGAIAVGGVRYGDLHDVIARRVSRQYRGFQLEVTPGRLHGVTVYVTGFAAAPGSYTVGSLSTLVNAVLASGGPAAGGSFRSIQLRRGGKLVSDFDLYDLLLKGDRSGDAVLQNGDVLYIAPAGEQVAVIGSVNREAIFEVAPGETVSDAIRYAGGVNTVADASRLMVFDSLGRDGKGWEELSAADAGMRKARRGDIVRVLSQVGIARPLAQQSVLVTISGEVAKPGRYYFQPGTRLDQVVAQAGGLTPQAFPYASVITRESVKAQQQQSFDRAVQDAELLLTAQPVTSANRAQLVQPANLALVRSIVDQLRERRPNGRLVFDLPVTAQALPGALVLENNDTIYVPPRPVTVGVFGAVPTPASFAWRERATIGDFVQSAGGVQKLGDRNEIFVVRANGTVLADGKRVLRAPALPGDLVYVPIDANRGEFWARLRDITSSLFGGVIGAASIVNLTQ
ncbi:SLBB domain-containing protein [Sphingomonas sp. HF-S4]|uniref:SLBB domain-containing protein n=1 Tax=Sphingomonas agrestis TaxID=3080540 RepID=A0ABU3Y8U3_9SPHN|nr:SLBB domain-containing protein [Sphingomonas sp. HF-S4]MDV3457843.1 SLBB domain-containing protein [Sphingomonas sp. HF-S4]